MLQMLAGFDITQTKPIRKKQQKNNLKLENYIAVCSQSAICKRVGKGRYSSEKYNKPCRVVDPIPFRPVWLDYST